MREHANAAGLERRGDRQHLRGDGRGRAPGAPGYPARPPRAPRCQDRRHRLRGADRSRPLRAHGRGRSRHRQPGEDARRDLPGAFGRGHRAGRGQRHHVGARDRFPSDRGLRLEGARLCADPERLRPSLHVLRHPVRPRAVALGAGGRGGGAGPPARREGLCRDRADRRRHHRLRRRPSRRDDARQAGAQGASSRAGAAAPQALLHRFDRGRSRAHGGDRRGGAADAASPSLAPVRRRPHAEAHEAAPLPAPIRSRSARRCAACAPTSCSAPT